jgi:hypothetical protein
MPLSRLLTARLAVVPLLMAMLASAPVLSAGDVEVRLANGDSVFGELISQDATEVVIIRHRWTHGGMITGKVSYPHAQVAQVTPVPDLKAFYAAKDKATPDTYDGQYALVKWCQDRGLTDEAYAHAKHLYDRDPSDAITIKLLEDLGYVLDHGVWQKEADFAKSHGLVEYDGRYMLAAEADARKALIKANSDHDAASHRVKMAQAQVDYDQRRQDDSAKHLAQIQANIKAQADADAKAAAAAAKAQGQQQPPPPADAAGTKPKPPPEDPTVTYLKKEAADLGKITKKDSDELAAATAALTAADATVASDEQAVDADAIQTAAITGKPAPPPIYHPPAPADDAAPADPPAATPAPAPVEPQPAPTHKRKNAAPPAGN